MAQLFDTPLFASFGPDALHAANAASALTRIAGPRAAVLKVQLRQHGPRKAGVYGMLDGHDELLYVGKAKNLRVRLLSYFRKRGDPKARRLMQHVRSIVWEAATSEFAALHRELEVIRRWRPRWNVKGQPRSLRRLYLCVGRLPAPYVFLSNQPPAQVTASYGPLFGGAQLDEAVRRLNDAFQLRDCAQSQTMHFAEQSELFPTARAAGCLRYEIGTCLGPCAAACTRSDYFERVRDVRGFLDGTDVMALRQLETALQAAAAVGQYERAAVLRDKLASLQWLFDQLTQLRQLRAWGSFLYPVVGHDERTRWYLIADGQTLAALTAASAAEAQQQARTLLAQAQLRPQRPFGERENLHLLMEWFRRNPGEWQRTIASPPR